MPEARIVPRAEQLPGSCFITGETQGPFIDTGRNVRRHGRLYISLRHLAPVLRRYGWRTEGEVEERVGDLETAVEQLEGLREDSEAYHNLVEKLTDLLPAQEPEVRERLVQVHRAPTDEEIESWVQAHPDHRVLRQHRVPEEGSAEEYRRLYGQTPLATSRTRPEPEETEPTGDPGTEPSGKATYNLHGQDVDLDDLLAHNVEEIVEFAEGHEDEFLEALVVREQELAEAKGRKVRSTLLTALGYDAD